MARVENNFAISNGTSMNSKIKFHLNVRKLVLLAYVAWIICSLFIASTHPNRYAAFFTDLPTQLKNFPPFILSLAYLSVFIPALLSMIAYVVWILIYTLFKRFGK